MKGGEGGEEREKTKEKSKQELMDLVHKGRKGKERNVLSTQGEAWHWLCQDSPHLCRHMPLAPTR